MMLVLWASVTGAVAARTSRMIKGRVVVWLMHVVLLISIVPWIVLSAGPSGPARAFLGATLAISAVVAVRGSARRGVAFVVFVCAFVVSMSALALTPVTIDVQAFLESGLDALWAGRSPYAITVDLPYSVEQTRSYFPDGPVEDGVVPFGYPYLPSTLLLDLPAHLLGEVRWMHVACLFVAGVAAWRLATDKAGRVAALLVALSPVGVLVLLHYWVEPIMVMLLAVVVASLRAGKAGWCGVMLGLLFSSKQHAVAFVPILVSVGRKCGWRTVALSAVVGGLIVSVFLLWDAREFLRSTVEFPALLGVRPDSVSVLAQLDARVGPVPHWTYVLSPAAGLATSALIVWRTRPGPTSVAIAVGLSLLVTLLLAKQAFMNYYLLAGTALLLAGIVWPTDDPRKGADADEPFAVPLSPANARAH
jgi:hypothetical protein